MRRRQWRALWLAVAKPLAVEKRPATSLVDATAKGAEESEEDVQPAHT